MDRKFDRNHFLRMLYINKLVPEAQIVRGPPPQGIDGLIIGLFYKLHSLIIVLLQIPFVFPSEDAAAAFRKLVADCALEPDAGDGRMGKRYTMFPRLVTASFLVCVSRQCFRKVLSLAF